MATVIASAGPDPTLGSVYSDLDLTEAAILFGIAGDVGDTVEAAHFLGDLGKGGIQIGEVPGRIEGSSSRGPRQFSQVVFGLPVGGSDLFPFALLPTHFSGFTTLRRRSRHGNGNGTGRRHAQRTRVSSRNGSRSKLEDRGILEKKFPLLRKEEAEAGQVDLLVIGFYLCEVCVHGQVQHQLRTQPVL